MRLLRIAAIVTSGSVATLAAGWGIFASVAWLGYGRLGVDRTADPALDSIMPTYEVAERHETTVDAPADVTFAAASRFSLEQSPLIRLIFRTREVILHAPHDDGAPSQPLLEQTKTLGWGVLAERPHRVVVMGAVTQPWRRDIVFRALPPAKFVAFDDPGYVKIAWTIEVEPATSATSIFRTVTRVQTTDSDARRKFRRYWAFFSPGIWLIRKESLRIVRADAEQCFR